ncbi:MAG: V-type ATPase 116kDa subunit family protein [Acidobacteriaceae bacterium]|nr:V-type ATPase 116kDa subunit family protein [Acidobacteriaceae bacterium]
MSILRSEDMGLFTLNVDKNFSWDVMESLGRLSCLHFVDVNSREQVYNRPYSAMVRRCDEAHRRIRYIESLCEQYRKNYQNPRSVEVFMANLQQTISSKGKDSMAYFEEIEQILESNEAFFLRQQKEAEATFAKYTSVVQHKYVLNKAAEIVMARSRYGLRIKAEIVREAREPR